MRKKSLLTTLILITLQLLNYSSNKLQAQVSPQAGKIVVDSLYGFEMVYIPAGDLEWQAHTLRHAMTVHIDGFYIGKYEVTQKLWKKIMGEYPVTFNWDGLPVELKEEGVLNKRIKELVEQKVLIGDDLPAEKVSWDAVQVFLKRLSEKTGHKYRLPTEAEWEYAYRANTTTDYYFGNDTLMLAQYEWYNENSDRKPHSVGLKKPNPWGLYDMGGNVAEWTSSIADMAAYERDYPGHNFGPGIQRIYRGSHYLHTKFAAVHSWVHTYLQALPRGPVGFRIVRDR